MPQKVLAWLQPQRGGTILDGTVGLGGHARLLAEAVGKEGHIIGLDRDPHALSIAEEVLRSTPAKITLVKARFSEIGRVLSRLGLTSVDGILLDLGVSSLQLEDPARGFSFQHDGPLDMRMDPDLSQTAEDWIRTASEETLAKIFFEYGEERYARRIARSIVARREEEPIHSTRGLADLIAQVVPGRGRIHPATRVFQALRIVVNDELGELERGLEEARQSLRPGGRLVVISFHSLEDRIVKRTMQAWEKEGIARRLLRKVLTPSREERMANRRSRSAKLRVCEMVGTRPAEEIRKKTNASGRNRG